MKRKHIIERHIPAPAETKRAAHQFYLAYGANTNIASMSIRCPAAKPVGRIELEGHRLQFRGVADVIATKREPVLHLALWKITDECERALDAFEGFPFLYIKRYIPIEYKGRTHQAMLYVMRERSNLALPSNHYEQTLRVGYDEFGMPHEQIDKALERARHAYVQHEPRPRRTTRPARAVRDLWTPYYPSDDDAHIGDVPTYIDDDGHAHY